MLRRFVYWYQSDNRGWWSPTQMEVKAETGLGAFGAGRDSKVLGNGVCG